MRIDWTFNLEKVGKKLALRGVISVFRQSGIVLLLFSKCVGSKRAGGWLPNKIAVKRSSSGRTLSVFLKNGGKFSENTRSPQMKDRHFVGCLVCQRRFTSGIF